MSAIETKLTVSLGTLNYLMTADEITILDQAIDDKLPEVLDVLILLGRFNLDDELELEADPAVEDAYRHVQDGTWLMSAAKNGKDWFADWLLERGSDPTRQDANGQTAANYATWKGHTALADKLENAEKIWQQQRQSG